MTVSDERTVLVVDDDPIYRELLTIGLSGEGYNVLLAENGVEAQSIVRSEPVDAVVVDLLMPLLDGLRFIHWMRKSERHAAPILVLTSVDDRDLSVEAMVAGATDVVAKPVSLPGLTKKLELILTR